MGDGSKRGDLSAYSALISVIDDPVVVIDPERWRLLEANDRALDLFGFDTSDGPPTSADELTTDVTPVGRSDVLAAANKSTEREAVWRVETMDGSRTFDVTITPHSDDRGTVLFVSLAARDTEDRFEHRLAALSRATNELAAATSLEEAGEAIVAIATEVLDRSFVGVWLYDDEADVLRPEFRSESVDGIQYNVADLQIEPGSFGMEAFRQGAIRVVDDYDTIDGRSFAELPFKSFVLCPVGDHGLLTTGSLEPEAFEEADRHLFDILADAARATFDRLDRERESRELHERLEVALENAPLVMFTIDEDGVFQWSGGAALSKLGITPSETIGQTIYDMYGDFPDIIEAFERALDGEAVTFSVEVEGVSFETSYRPVTDETGEVERVVGVATDVTSLKSRERQIANLNHAVSELFELSDTEAVYEFVVETATTALGHPYAAVWTPNVEPEGLHAVAVSTAAQSLADEAGGELIHGPESKMWAVYESGDTRRFHELSPDDTATGVPIQSAVAIPLGEYGLLTVGHRSPDAFSDREMALLETLGDLTTGALDRLERQRELHLMSTVIDRAAIGLAIIDATADDYPIIYVNEGFEAVTGYSAEMVEGKNPDFLRGADTDEQAIGELGNALRSGTPTSQVLLNYRKDGTPFWNQVDVIPITDEDGTTTHALRFQRDVTDRVRREQQVQVLNRVLRHNLRTDMTVIKGFADHLVEELDDDRGEYAETIVENADELIGLSQKIRQSMQVIQDETTRTAGIREILEKQVSVHRERYPSAQISVSIPEEPFLVDGPVEIVVRELLENALEHNDSDNPVVVLSVEGSEPEWIELRVQDNGSGIPESEREPLLSGEETPLSHASGFGLWLVQWTVVNLGGRFSLSDGDPEGTVATVRIPLAEESTLPPDPPVPDPSDPG